MHRRLRGLLYVAPFFVSAALLVRLLRRARAETIPFSPVFGGRRIGADFPEQRALTTDETVAGEMDDMAAYARPVADAVEAFDPDAVDPAVRAFYERTADYQLTYRTRWHRGFRTGAALATLLTARIGQLNLPGPAESKDRKLRSQFVRLRPSADPREGVRAWVRTDPDSEEAVFVALYASHERNGERFVNIAAPLPGANLSTVLRIEHLPLGEREDGRTGVELTTRGDGDPGLYLVTPAGAFALPMEQRFRVWPAGADGAPAAADGRAALVATHEMWILGHQFLTVEYGIRAESA